MATELDTAEQRVHSIRRAGERLDPPALARSLGRIADAAAAMIADLARDPRDYRRLRKPLVHYLAHVEIIADRFATLRAAGSADGETTRRTEKTLADLERVFAEYGRRMVANEASDLDARIALLEQEIRAEGITEPPMPPPPRVDRGGRR